MAKNPTLYIQNLNERVKIPDLKNALYQLFSTNAAQHGAEVVEVHAKRNIKARGQAFVVFNDEDAAEAALQSLRGHMFFGKPLRINYAKKESDVTKKMRGTFEESEKTSRETKRVQELSIPPSDCNPCRDQADQAKEANDRQAAQDEAGQRGHASWQGQALGPSWGADRKH